MSFFKIILMDKNIAVLGRVCAEVITKCLYHAQNALRLVKKILNKFYQRALTIIKFFYVFQVFIHSLLAIRCNRQQEMISIPRYSLE